MWTSLIIKEQKQNKTNPKVDFRMLVIKLHFYAWLFHAWTQFIVRKAMIYKGWEKKPSSKFQFRFSYGSIKSECYKKFVLIKS